MFSKPLRFGAFLSCSLSRVAAFVENKDPGIDARHISNLSVSSTHDRTFDDDVINGSG